MLILCRISIIGFHLLLLSHIAHTFVLLTANVDDVKKLARKFVSDSLAEKIAEFISTATKSMTTHLSEENDMNGAEDSHQVSEENNRYNIERHGFESAAQENAKSREDILEKPEEESLPETSISKEQKEIAEKSDFDNKIHKEKRVKPEYSVRLEGPSRYVKVTPNTVKQYAYTLEDRERDKKPNHRISEEDEKYNRENAPKYKDENIVTPSPAPSNSLYAERYSADNKPARKKVKGRPYRLLSHLNSIEDNEVTDIGKDFGNISNGTIDDFSENELFNQRTSAEQELTTKKAVFEFDQYDTKKYNQNEFLATSGSVVLRRVPEAKMTSEKWWEKGLPIEVDSKRKTWY